MFLEIADFSVLSSQEIQLRFNFNLSLSINKSNFSLQIADNYDEIEIRAIQITNDVVTLFTAYHYPSALHIIKCFSTEEVPFVSEDGTLLNENNISNTATFVAIDKASFFYEDTLNKITPDIYSNSKESTIASLVKPVAFFGDEALESINEASSANYISVPIKDEVKTRSGILFDKLNNAGAYRINRVSKYPSTVTFDRTYKHTADDFSNLFRSDIEEYAPLNYNVAYSELAINEEIAREIVSNDSESFNGFEGLKFTLENRFITRLFGVIQKRDGESYYYDFKNYKYNLLRSRFDLAASREDKSIKDNEFILSREAINDGYFLEPVSSDEFVVIYGYENINKVVNQYKIYSVLRQIREPVEAMTSLFQLQNGFIVKENNSEAKYKDVKFLNTNPSSSGAYKNTHPAFIKEVAFNYSNLPSTYGEYSVDYNTGKVFVYGASSVDGTGDYPPVCNYFYRKYYTEGEDYTVDGYYIKPTASGELIGKEFYIDYNYSDVLINGVDYLEDSNVEIVNEFVGASYYKPNKIVTKKYPIKEVSGIFNQTTGESYSVLYDNDFSVYFSGLNAPKTSSINNAILAPSYYGGVELVISDVISSVGGSAIVKINLGKLNISASSSKLLGSKINTSLILPLEYFVNEYFFDVDSLTNYEQLVDDGDYVVDYKNGLIYLRTSEANTTSLGTCSFSCLEIKVLIGNILSCTDAGIYKTATAEKIVNIPILKQEDSIVTFKEVPYHYEDKVNDTEPLVIGSVANGSNGICYYNSSLFSDNSEFFKEEYSDGYHYLKIGTDEYLIEDVDVHSVYIDGYFAEAANTLDWQIINYNETTEKTVSVKYDISYLNSLYFSGNFDFNILENYESSYENNLITISDPDNLLSIGSSVVADYSYGAVMASYETSDDELVISYEYGNNAIRFINDKIKEGSSYFISYDYGCKKEDLLSRFMPMVGNPQLNDYYSNGNTFLLRDFTGGALAAFNNGSTRKSIKDFVSRVLKEKPVVQENNFDELTIGRDYLTKADGYLSGVASYETCKFNNGILLSKDNYFKINSDALIKNSGGTICFWTKPHWAGLDNDADITVTLSSNGVLAENASGLDYDGYLSLIDIYIGESNSVPTSNGFTLNKADALGRPSYFGFRRGFFIWFDSIEDYWNIAFSNSPNSDLVYTGEIVTDGGFVDSQISLNSFNATTFESNDLLTTISNKISFSSYIDGYDADGYMQRYADFYYDSVKFKANDYKYFFDDGYMSLFKDPNGFLNFKIKDKKNRVYCVSKDISDWEQNSVHHIGASFAYNTRDSLDQIHLFVDGSEAPNLNKLGSSGFILGAESSEEINISSNIIGGIDGYSIEGSAYFYSAEGNFSNANTGDYLYLEDYTVDGAASPFTVISVISNYQIQLDSALSLTLEDIKYSLNKDSFEVATDIINDNFCLYNGQNLLDDSSYFAYRENGKNYLQIRDEALNGDILSIKTYGLKANKVSYYIDTYEDGYSLKLRGSQPSNKNQIDLTKVISKVSLVEEGGSLDNLSGSFSMAGTSLVGTFTNSTNLSNSVNGKKISLIVRGSNIGTATDSYVVINGNTYDGYSSETILIDGSNIFTTESYFLDVSSFEISINVNDIILPACSLEIREAIPLTQSENNGDYADIVDLDSNKINLEIYGSGGTGYLLEAGCYLINYTSTLNIDKEQTNSIVFGTSWDKSKNGDFVIEELQFIPELLLDSKLDTSGRNITKEYNRVIPLDYAKLNNLGHFTFNNSTKDFVKAKASFENYAKMSSDSVNDNFGNSALLAGSNITLVNDEEILSKNAGTIEFWIKPLVGSLYDDKDRYYFDITTNALQKVTSISKKVIKLTSKASKIHKIIFKDKEYIEGSILLADGLTIELTNPLPSNNCLVSVSYTPQDFNGDRISIFKDGDSYLNFKIEASNKYYLLKTPIAWDSSEWHRVVASYSVNNKNNKDKMRLIVDGVAYSNITYGSVGKIYGSGFVYGDLNDENVESNLLADINVKDSFSNIYIGSSYDNNNYANCKIDNIRFSYVARDPDILFNQITDFHYSSNLNTVLPVSKDNLTSLLLDFEESEEILVGSSLLISSSILENAYCIKIKDPEKILQNNAGAKEVLESLLEDAKPAHIKLYIMYE